MLLLPHNVDRVILSSFLWIGYCVVSFVLMGMVEVPTQLTRYDDLKSKYRVSFFICD